MIIAEEKRVTKVVSTAKGTFIKDFFKVLTNLKFIFFLRKIPRKLEDFQLITEKDRSIRRFMRRSKSFIFVIGIILVFIVVNMAVFQHWISSYEKATQTQLGPWAPPSSQHPLGTTWGGLDVLARIVFGARFTLIIILSSTLISAIAGTIIGLISAYYGGWFDMLVMRIMDIILSFPGVVFAILFLLIWGRSIEYIILAFGIIGIPTFSRIIRTFTLKQKELPYIQAAKVIGARNRRIMFRHILPNCYQPILVSASFNVGKVLLGYTVLAFLGISRLSWVDWGGDVIYTINQLYRAPWASFWPMIMIIATIMGFLFIGDGLRDAFALKTEQI
ncbi:MAG: ABC transporter permease [Candidatus Heimdallarchaeota archaeon]